MRLSKLVLPSLAVFAVCGLLVARSGFAQAPQVGANLPVFESCAAELPPKSENINGKQVTYFGGKVVKVMYEAAQPGRPQKIVCLYGNPGNGSTGVTANVSNGLPAEWTNCTVVADKFMISCKR